MTIARRGTVARQIDLLFGAGTVAGSADRELLGRFVATNDESSFAALVARHGPMVLGVCRGVLRSRHDAEDAFQATFLILARKAATLRSSESLAGWLQRVAHRVAVQAASDRMRRSRKEGEAAFPPDREEDREAPWDALLERLHEEIGRLPEKYRAPIVLCDLESMTREQAAGLLGWPPGTVAGRLARARDLLRERLTRRTQRALAPATLAALFVTARSAAAALPQAWIDRTVFAAAGKAAAGTVSLQVLRLVDVVRKGMLRSQIKRGAAAFGIASALSGLLAAAVLGGAAAPPIAHYHGTVVDSHGRPAAGAEVILAEGSPWLRNSPGSLTLAPAVLPIPAVLQRERADAAGGFRVAVPPFTATTYRHWRPLVLWTRHAGGALELRTVPNGWPAGAEPVALRLKPPAPVRLQVNGPDGRPVAGARVAPARIRGTRLPTALADELVATTDRQGRTTLLAVAAPDDLELVRVDADGLGSQMIAMTALEATEVRTLQAARAGRVEGVIKAEDPAATRGVPVRLHSRTDRSDRNSGVGGVAEVITDEHGRFAVPAMAAGDLAISLRIHSELPFLGAFNATPNVPAGGTTRVEIVLERAVRVHGVVRDRDTGAPVAGALMSVGRDWDSPFARTDAEGRYSTFASPGRLSCLVSAVPPPYYTIDTTVYQDEVIPRGAREFAAQPRLVVRGTAVQGKVVDRKGRPVAAASVTAEWPEPTFNRDRMVVAVTNRAGEFRVEGIGAKAEVKLTAICDELATAAPVAAQAGGDAVTVVVEPGHLVALTGRVVDSAGRPVAGVPVRLERYKPDPGFPNALRSQLVAFDDSGTASLRTDAAGRFSTPRHLRADWMYRASLAGDGPARSATSWLDPSISTSFEDLIIRPVSAIIAVEGRVLDSAGRPVAGAEVFQSGDGPVRTRTTADGEGRFRLEGVYRGRALLFVERAGVRFAGHPIDASGESVDVRVRRDEDPADPALRTLPAAWPWERSRAELLRILATADLERQAAGDEGYVTYRSWLPIQARVDFRRALELLDVFRRAQPQLDLRLRAFVAEALARENADDGTVLIETIENPAGRSGYYRTLSDVLPRSERARKVELLDVAVKYARTGTVPTRAAKCVMYGSLGACLVDAGEIDRGTELLREAQRIAEGFPGPRGGIDRADAWARTRLAPKLARIDEPAALALIEGAAGPEGDAAFAGVALGLAERDPQAALRALGRVSDQHTLDQYAPRVAGRIAMKDPARAREFALSLKKPESRALALAVMARNLAESGSNARSAVAQVDEVMNMLAAADPEVRGVTNVRLCLAVSLLPLAERLDPALLRRTFWRAASFRPPRPPAGDPEGIYEVEVGILAAGLARYDRELAWDMLAPIVERVRAIDVGRGYPVFKAIAAIDPARALAILDTLPDEAQVPKQGARSVMRQAIAEVLSYRTAALWDELEPLGYEDSRVNE